MRIAVFYKEKFMFENFWSTKIFWLENRKQIFLASVLEINSKAVEIQFYICIFQYKNLLIFGTKTHFNIGYKNLIFIPNKNHITVNTYVYVNVICVNHTTFWKYSLMCLINCSCSKNGVHYSYTLYYSTSFSLHFRFFIFIGLI